MPIRTGSLTRRRVLQYLPAAAVGCATLASRAAAIDRLPLWEISLSRAKVYLLGHTPPRATAWKDERVQTLLRGCVGLWNETNHRSSANVQELIQEYGLAHDQSLEGRLDAGQRARLSAASKAVGVATDSLTHFRPWLAGQTLEDALFSAPPFDKPQADQVLVAAAQSLSIPVSSEFATLPDVVHWFAGLTPIAEVQYLMYIVDEVLMGQQKGQRIYAAWDGGDVAPATAWMGRMAHHYPELYQAIDVMRNRRWVPRVRSMLNADRPSMIVTGLYHLVGPDRLQAQLASAGLRVRQIQ